VSPQRRNRGAADTGMEFVFDKLLPRPVEFESHHGMFNPDQIFESVTGGLQERVGCHS
jgi:hypothetical protein